MKNDSHEEHDETEAHEEGGTRQGRRPGIRLPPPPSVEAERAMHRTIGCAMAVHRSLGPGFLESIYRQAMYVHRAQLISYLRTTGLRGGLLINFDVRLLKDGIQRVVL